MAADVLERAQSAVVAADDQYRVWATPVFEIVTRLGDVVDRAGDLPHLRPHPLDLELRERPRSSSARQAPGWGGRRGADRVLPPGVGSVADRGTGLRCVRHDWPFLIRLHTRL